MLRLPRRMARIPPYEMGDLLGSGGFGDVYKAIDPAEPRRALAIKVLHRELARQDDVAARFFQEALVLARLDHPLLPRILGFGPHDGTYYIVQEFIDGAPLDDVGDGLPFDEAIGVLHQLLEATGYAHGRGVIHRDLKPQNLLRQADGRLKVLDFGLAKIAGQRGAGGSSGGLGTVCWSAPEQLRGDEVDGRADLFSAGLLLHHLLTGRPPVTADDLGAYIAWAEGDDRSSLRRLRPDTPSWLERLFVALTHADPQRRFRDAAEALSALIARGEDDGVQIVDAGFARMKLTASFDREAFAQDDDPLCHALLSVELEAGDHAAAVEISADIFLVLDVSGSMNGPDRYPLLRKAVGEFLRRMSPRDRVGLAVFSTGAEVTSGLTAGEAAGREADAMIGRMDRSKFMFGGATNLAPGLELARQHLTRAKRPGKATPVRRVYVLTDGDIHDAERCKEQLAGYAQDSVEVHVYGFGSGFNGAALKELVAEQRGGSVKPICNEQDVIETFAHIAAVNQRLLGQEGRLSVAIEPDTDAGDAWLFRPQERYLGPIPQRLVARDLGGVEAGRPYAVLVELRLPPAEAQASTPVATVTLSMLQGDRKVELTGRVSAARQRGGHGAPVEAVERARAILEALRSQGDQGVELAAARARLAMASAEKRDPGLLEALRKRIDVLEGRASEHDLGAADRQYLASDESSMLFSFRGS